MSTVINDAVDHSRRPIALALAWLKMTLVLLVIFLIMTLTDGFLTPVNIQTEWFHIPMLTAFGYAVTLASGVMSGVRRRP